MVLLVLKTLDILTLMTISWGRQPLRSDKILHDRAMMRQIEYLHQATCTFIELHEVF